MCCRIRINPRIVQKFGGNEEILAILMATFGTKNAHSMHAVVHFHEILFRKIINQFIIIIEAKIP